MLLHGTPTPCQWFPIYESALKSGVNTGIRKSFSKTCNAVSTCSDSTEGKTHLCHGISRRTQHLDAVF